MSPVPILDLRSLAGALAALVLWAGSGVAQDTLSPPVRPTALTVQGEVLDGLTGMPVRGVVVQFPLLGKVALTDSLGYWALTGVPVGDQRLAAYHVAYETLVAETPVVAGDILVLKLTPRPMAVRGLDVGIEAQRAREGRRSGTPYDVISDKDVDALRNRTNKVLEVLRAKAPPRLVIQQEGPGTAVKFCIQSSRRTPSVQEIRDSGFGCRPSMIIMDGIVLYAPPLSGDLRKMQSPDLPSDVAHMIVNMDPEVIQDVRILQPSQAYFRYGESGRFGAVEIRTRRGRR